MSASPLWEVNDDTCTVALTGIAALAPQVPATLPHPPLLPSCPYCCRLFLHSCHHSCHQNDHCHDLCGRGRAAAALPPPLLLLLLLRHHQRLRQMYWQWRLADDIVRVHK